MATYELPREPGTDVIWTTHSPGASSETVTTEWHRARHHVTNAPLGWLPTSGGNKRYSWFEILSLGDVVHDVHPDLSGVSALPWRLAYGGSDEPELLDNWDLAVDALKEENTAFIVKAVNKYAERYTGGAS